MRIFIKFVLLGVVFSSAACSDRDDSNIPERTVNLSLYLDNYPTFKNGIGAYLICPADLKSTDRVGSYGYGGILLVHAIPTGGTSDFVAYDRTCPFEVNASIKVSVNEDGYAYCTSCGSQFDIISGYGNALSGSKSHYPLRRYTTHVSSTLVHGDVLYVTN